MKENLSKNNFLTADVKKEKIGIFGLFKKIILKRN